MRGRGVGAAAGGTVLLASLWLPWFHRRLAAVFAPVRAERSLSGWKAVGGLGVLLAVVAVSSVTWGLLRARRPSALWLVVAGALALMTEVAVTVARVGADDNGQVVTTTSPGFGLVLAFAGAVLVVLSGLASLGGEARRQLQTG